MNRLAIGLSIATAFAAGCGATYLLGPALAAESITPQIIHTGEMEGDALGPANKVGYRSKTFMTADGATVSIQVGNVPKHLHPNTNEIQYILDGHRNDLARRQGGHGEAGRPRHHPEGHAAWRHQADQRTSQGDRDQDAAAGARRHQAAGLSVRYRGSRLMRGPRYAASRAHPTWSAATPAGDARPA